MTALSFFFGLIFKGNDPITHFVDIPAFQNLPNHVLFSNFIMGFFRPTNRIITPMATIIHTGTAGRLFVMPTPPGYLIPDDKFFSCSFVFVIDLTHKMFEGIHHDGPGKKY